MVIIHGVGEQRPLDTLRKFVKNVVGGDFRNKPDQMSTTFELRRLQLPGKRYQPQTDFYEYYWAHHMRDTKARMLISWFRSLLWRSPCSISSRLRPFYCFIWGGVIGIFLLLLVGYVKIGLGLLAFLVGSFFIDYNWTRIGYGIIDDAARYLSPTPDNIKQRNQIRKEGIELLNSLHKSKKYNRIVIVGHSLGSVIAYDLIRLYWATLVPTDGAVAPNRDFLKSWREKSDAIMKNTSMTKNQRVDAFQQLQNSTWLELRKSKWPWLIHDLITIGSPLSHAETLLAGTPGEFNNKKYDGEYPCVPPLDNHELYYSRRYTLENGDKRSAVVPTHLVPFLCTRWTNIYFPHRKLIMGDLIGGPLRSVLGPGIRDIEVGLQGVSDTLLSHSKYWDHKRGKQAKEGCRHPTDEIAKYLRLDIERGRTKLPPP